MRKNDAEVCERKGWFARRTECLNAINGVEWDPAHDEKQHDNGEVLSGLHLTPLCSTKHPKFGSRRRVHARHLTYL